MNERDKETTHRRTQKNPVKLNTYIFIIILLCPLAFTCISLIQYHCSSQCSQAISICTPFTIHHHHHHHHITYKHLRVRSTYIASRANDYIIRQNDTSTESICPNVSKKKTKLIICLFVKVDFNLMRNL